MPLVAYDSSSSDADDDNYNDHKDSPNNGTPASSSQKRRRIDSSTPRLNPPADKPPSLPPLPPSFHDLYATNTRVSTKDDPSLHAGRKRQVPHVEGNWPTHIFIEWHPTPAQSTTLHALIASVVSSSSSTKTTPLKIHPSLSTDLGVAQPLHISLSAPLQLRTEQRTPFLAAAERAVRRACPHGAFRVALAGLGWARNADASRWFLAQRVARPPGDELHRLLRGCNAVAGTFGLARLYGRAVGEDEGGEADGEAGADVRKKDHSANFHFSIGWTLTPPAGAVQDGANAGLAQVDEELLKAVQAIVVDVDAVKVKIGNTVTAIALAARDA